MKTISKGALAALTLAVAFFASQVQAHTLWRFPYKSTPYAVPHTHVDGGYKVSNPYECPRAVIRHSFRSKAWLVCPDR